MSAQGMASRAALVTVLTLAGGGPAAAAQFHLFLDCEGTVSAGGRQKPATLSLALRDSNTTALIQRSNVLPIGETLRYTPTPQAYTLRYKLPLPGTQYQRDWMNGQWLVWQPNLKSLATIRLAVDRQTGELEGDMLDHEDRSLGTIAMQCEPQTMDEAPEPRF